MRYQLPFPLDATPANGEFGNNAPGRANPHRGHDFSQFHLTRLGLSNTVTAVGDGTVVTVLTGDRVFGRLVVVKHADGAFSAYAHLNSIAVSVGQSVSIGQALGVVGSSGQVTGAHLHLNMGPSATSFRSGVAWDPIAYIQARQGDPEARKAEVRLLSRFMNTLGLGLTTTADRDGIPGSIYWKMVQTLGHNRGLYGAGYLIDGKPGTRTYQLESAFIVEARVWEAEQNAPKPPIVVPVDPTPEPVPPIVPEPEPTPEVPPVVAPVEPPAKKTPPLWVILSGGIVTLAIAVASVLKSLAII